METTDELKAAKDVIQALLKVKKTIRMYPENNPMYQKTLQDTFLRFTELFRYRHEFTLRIKQNEILFDTEQIYVNPEKDDNLALFFFKDGLRELTFKSALSESELEEFSKIIALDYDREAVDDDVVTLLWEKDFQNISYVADEAFLMEDEDYESRAVSEVKKKSPGSDEILKAYSSAFESEEMKEVSIVTLTDRDLQALVKEMERDALDKTAKIYDILFEMLFQSDDPAELEDMRHLFRNAFLYCIVHGNIKTLVEVLKKTRELTLNASVPDAIKRQLGDLLSEINTEESIKNIGLLFDSDTAVDESLVAEYMEFLDRSAISPFLRLLGELESIRGRKTAISILIHLGKKDIQAIARGLQDQRWFVVRNIIYVLRNIGDKKAVEYLLSSAKHSDERVRKEAIKALGELKSPLALQVLKECLRDPDSSIRKAAARALGTIGSDTARRIIIEEITGKDYGKKEFDEKKDLFEVLARWSDQETMAFLVSTLKKRSLFKRALSDENQACAAFSLGLIGNKDVLPALHALRDARSKLVRDYVAAAIKRIEYAR